ncbi:toxin-antitoxin system HicB family antitoxin [Psychrobacter sp. FME61]|uniref:toxin-antitoxin system HicB family antitoxin n=1 Tax=unclassified Psychrobacter TaxID=196806 RepID=UPI0039AF19FC
MSGDEYMSNQKVQMNVRVSKELKRFAVSDAKNQFHSLSQYIEKLIFKAKELNELEKK